MPSLSNHLILGIDTGSTASSLALISQTGKVLHSSYRFHNGQIAETLSKQLEEIPLKNITQVAYTSSCPSIFQTGLKADSRVAYITSAKHFQPDLEALLIIGGEKFGLVRFGKNGEYQNYRANSSCAAGTGSFLDQQLSRLNLASISMLSDLAYNFNGNFPKIASRCSVFAKTDLIHAQQEGFSLAAICDGLCYGLAKNVVNAVFNESEVGSLVVAGGVSLNEGVMKHIREITGARLIRDEYSNLYGAIGAALLHCNTPPVEASFRIDHPRDILSPPKSKKQFYNPPLKLKLSDYPDFSALEEYTFKSKRHVRMSAVEVSVYEFLQPEAITEAYLGIDIGSTSTKAILLDMEKKVLAGFYTRTSGQPLSAVQTVFEAIVGLEEKAYHHFLIKGAGTTGSGRKLIGEIILADTVPDEITAHARAAVELDPKTDTIIEIGGQDSKFTLLKDGIVTLSIMNNVCAAGTGSFIEEQANKLNCPLSEYAARASHSPSPLTSDRCTVFMERDLNHYLNEGYEQNELLASVLHSIRDNYLSKVTGKARIGDRIFFQGATAKNKALVAAFEQKLQKPIMVSKFCHLTGALGVALELHDNKTEQSSFRGLDLWKIDIPVRSEICNLCTNHCKLRVAEINEETAAYGFLCGRDYETQKYVRIADDNFDLIKDHRRVFSFHPQTKKSTLRIGIPSALFLAEEKLLWQKFFDELGIRTLTSEDYPDAVKTGKKYAEAEFCAPMAAAYGHVYYLRDKADFIFLPVYLERGRSITTSKKYCFYTQHLPAIIASTRDFRDSSCLLTPLVHSLKSESFSITGLHSMFQRIGLKHLQVRHVREAFEEASRFYWSKKMEWQEIFVEKVKSHPMAIVLIGRPYTILSGSMNNNIPEIVCKKGYPAFYMDMLPGDQNGMYGLSRLTQTLTWNYASEIIRVSEQVAASNNLYPVLVTSFKCTPDSFVIEYFREIMENAGKPYLILQLDEHDSSVGYETRIESAIRSFNNHFENQRQEKNLSIAKEKNEPPKGDGYSFRILQDLEDILKEFGIDISIFHKNHPDIKEVHDLSDIPSSAGNFFHGKTILMPGWDLLAGKLLVAILEADGKKAALLPDSTGSIQRSLNTNTGQCLPLNVITQNAYEYMVNNDLDPSEVIVWVPKGYLSCNLIMFPHYIRKLLRRFDEKMTKVSVFPGNPAFYDLSVRLGIYAFMAFLFAGNIRKIACSLRPYEKVRGSTDSAVKKSIELLSHAFANQLPKEPVLQEIMELFSQVEHEKNNRPKVAIFGDMYARDNDIFNQELIRVIEENGGEALTTSYSDYLKIILKQTELRLFHEGRYLEHYNLRVLKYLIPFIENRYNKYFEKYITSIYPLNDELFEILAKHHLEILHRGETVENILKIETLVRHYDDISLFVQTNPAYCCPSLVTQALSSHIEKLTGIPVVSIEYDGTHALKNEDIIPYLRLGRKKV